MPFAHFMGQLLSGIRQEILSTLKKLCTNVLTCPEDVGQMSRICYMYVLFDGFQSALLAKRLPLDSQVTSVTFDIPPKMTKHGHSGDLYNIILLSKSARMRQIVHMISAHKPSSVLNQISPHRQETITVWVPNDESHKPYTEYMYHKSLIYINH